MISAYTIKKQSILTPSVKRQSLLTPSIKRGSRNYYTDYDGNIYTSVIIGTQLWMVENLKTTHYSDGTPIQNITNGALWISDAAGAYCWHSNNIANKTIYGAIYNWFAVNHSGGLAPAGWRIATDTDWTTLTTTLGGLGVSGGILKSTGTIYWITPNTGAVDTYGFGMRGGAFRDEMTGAFTTIRWYGFAWTATAINAATAYGRGFSYNNDDVVRNAYDKNVGFSVRCVRDI